ncbi:LysR family transcriptional regulator [Psychromonas ossibalaenae]|uniref:LysR family transcriptional regulator n=1 Tax=Psychromonas ossibalaenae TaxID=444922 RepID=UPI000380FB1F|nr:LysR family transcriptional regulator [Psychromonas ossibalaenae]
MQHKFDFNLLVIFLEVYELRSITLAAESLGLTQPGVSGSLKRLQKALNTELFIREGRGISPTNAAIQLAGQISPAYNMINSALSNISGFDIQAPRTFLVYVNEAIMNILQPLVEKDPDMGNCNIEFHLTPGDEEQLLHELSLQKADLAIDIGKLHNMSYNSQLFYREEITLICRKDHPRISGEIDQQAFYQERHITCKVRRAERYVLDFFTEEVIRPRQVSCETNSLLNLMSLVSESDCISLTCNSMADKYAERFFLQRVKPPFTTKPVLHNMMWHKRNEYTPAHIWLREKLNSLISSV